MAGNHDEFACNGFAIFPQLLSGDDVAGLRSSLEQPEIGQGSRQRGGEIFGRRDILKDVPAIASLAISRRLRDIVVPVLGRGAAAVRALFFDKTPAANWRLGWHQDRAVSVASKCLTGGFGPWTVKAGVHHALAPAHVLESMVAVRLHLDDADATNGALEFILGSHAVGVLAAHEVGEYAASHSTRVCETQSGDAVLMRPLTIHRSAKSDSARHRRVIHIEYAAGPLPAPLEWNEIYSFDSVSSPSS